MRTKITLVLLFLNVALFFYITKFESIVVPDANGKRVYGPEAAAIDSFTRTSSSGATLRLEKRGDSWWLTQPYEWPANPNAPSPTTASRTPRSPSSSPPPANPM
ncbi:MAG: hypothetical protein HY302_04490 [Opitutae bacterium]|nr:hypothetical protein [Opitutae bacterium]